MKPIEDEIDEERRKVDAKTPITEEVRHDCSHLHSVCVIRRQ